MKHLSLKKLAITMTATIGVIAAATIGASACTTLYVGGNLVQEGTPFVARTEDYGSNMNKLWFVSEAGKWKKGETYTSCSAYGARKWTFKHDSYRFTHFTNDIYYDGICPECEQDVLTGDPADFHFSYTEFGTNEKGVSVSATETISGNRDVKAVDPLVKTGEKGGGIEETDIPTIILAEAASAREGIKLLCEIYDTYGAYFESGIFVCDQNEGWYIENCTGHEYVAIKLNNDMIFIEPNIAIIGEIDLDDTENVIASDRLIEVAKEAGTFVGDEEENIIDFKASYANNSSGNARMPDGLKFLNPDKYSEVDTDYLNEHNDIFTISNLEAGKIVPMYTNIEADRVLDKNDIFDFYKLSSIGKPSNQEIEIFQLFADEPLETGTVGWVGVGNMSYNVFVPYYPMYLDSSDDLYEGYQESTAVVTQSETKPDGFSIRTSASGRYTVYPENWRDSYYFTFEGLGGYIQYAEYIDGAPISEENKQYAMNQIHELQDSFNERFAELENPADTVALGKEMAQEAHEKGLELLDYLLDSNYTFTIEAPETMMTHEVAEASATLMGETNVTDYEHARILVEVTGPEGSNPQIIANDGHQDYNLAETGTWGPPDGFPVQAGYSAETPLKLSFDMAGEYTATFKLVDLDTDALLASGTSSITVVDPYAFEVTAPETMVRGDEAAASVTLKGIAGAPSYQAVVKVEVEGPDGAKIMATDTEGNEWNLAEIGQWGPDSGFAVTADYNVTTDLTLSFEQAGDYTATFQLVEVGTGKVLASGSASITVTKPSSSGGGSSSTTYAINVEDTRNGTVTVSPKRAERNDTVTVTVKPDDGYELDKLVITDQNGDKINFTSKGDGKYTFTMPRSKVTVEATFTAAEQEEPGLGFTDVNSGDWFYNAVEYMVDNSLMGGTSDTTFSPYTTLTRGMVAQILYAMEGRPAAEGSYFTDVADNAWYADAVNWAASEGIGAGVGENTFAPDTVVTREQLALILFNYVNRPETPSAELTFSDADSASAWSVDALEWAVGSGLISGKDNNMLDPQGTATRAEVAQIIANFIQAQQ